MTTSAGPASWAGCPAAPLAPSKVYPKTAAAIRTRTARLPYGRPPKCGLRRSGATEVKAADYGPRRVRKVDLSSLMPRLGILLRWPDAGEQAKAPADELMLIDRLRERRATI
jgi:hypothetical protein